MALAVLSVLSCRSVVLVGAVAVLRTSSAHRPILSKPPVVGPVVAGETAAGLVVRAVREVGLPVSLARTRPLVATVVVPGQMQPVALLERELLVVTARLVPPTRAVRAVMRLSRLRLAAHRPAVRPVAETPVGAVRRGQQTQALAVGLALGALVAVAGKVPALTLAAVVVAAVALASPRVSIQF